MRLFWGMVFLFPVVVWAQSTVPDTKIYGTLNQYIKEFSQVDGNTNSVADISNFLRKFEQRETPRSNFKFCRTIFYKTRQEFFRRYTQYASFEETLSKGKYNCLTGTALYALLLDHFNIPYDIIETNYHIFLLATTEKGPVLFEATDPLNGFVTDPEKIENRVRLYKQNTLQETPDDGKKYYAYAASLYQHVNLMELRGLLHYNVSIEAYNQQDFQAAIHHLDKALDLYNSPRISEFSAILLTAVLESKLDESTKRLYVNRVQSIRKKLPVMANRSRFAH